MISLSGDVPPSPSSTGGAGASETATRGLSAEADTNAGDTATKASSDTASATATSISHVVNLARVPGEVVRVGVAGSWSDDSAAPSVAESGSASAKEAGSAPPEEAGAPTKPIRGDLAEDATAETMIDVVAEGEAPDTSTSRGENDKEPKKGIPSTQEPSEEAEIEANAATEPVRLDSCGHKAVAVDFCARTPVVLPARRSLSVRGVFGDKVFKGTTA